MLRLLILAILAVAAWWYVGDFIDQVASSLSTTFSWMLPD
jgi:hypothetical protein